MDFPVLKLGFFPHLVFYLKSDCSKFDCSQFRFLEFGPVEIWILQIWICAILDLIQVLIFIFGFLSSLDCSLFKVLDLSFRVLAPKTDKN